MADRDVNPDSSLLTQIFGLEQPITTSIFLQDWDKCIFRADFSAPRSSCVVRLDAKDVDSEMFTAVAAIQEVASTILPDLVPKTYRIGKAKNLERRRFQFSVVALVEGDPLEDVWEKMGFEDKTSIISEILSALAKLHSVRISDWQVQAAFSRIFKGNDEMLKRLQRTESFGGPSTGFLDNGAALLKSVLEGRNIGRDCCTITSRDGSQHIRVISSYDELGSMVLDKSDVAKWLEEAVLCHNDLTPRNLLIKSIAHSNGGPKYKLSGIIDWELAGFFPASYELGLQDTYLGIANRHVSFYLMLKEQMAKIVRQFTSQIALLQAMDMIWESQQRCLFERHNIPAGIRKRFLDITGLTRSEDSYVGWRRIFDRVAVELDGTAYQKLVNDVVSEMITRRRN